jgi:DNA-binding CsgD family transcriptional regulator
MADIADIAPPSCPTCGHAVRRFVDRRSGEPPAQCNACRSRGATVMGVQLRDCQNRSQEGAGRRLAVRELEVLSCVASGMTTKGIARTLGISPRTVDAYAASLTQKLGAKNRTQAVAIAMRTGLMRAAPVGSTRPGPMASVLDDRSPKQARRVAVQCRVPIRDGSRPCLTDARSGAVDIFTGKHNLEHFANRLGVESDPARRETMLRLIVEEEDKLGFGLEQLEIAEDRIAAGNKRIAMQRAVVARLGNGGSDTRLAKDVLATLVKAQALFEDYRQKILRQLNGSPLH